MMTHHSHPQSLPAWDKIHGNALKLFFDADAQRKGPYVVLRHKNCTFDVSYDAWIRARKQLVRLGLLRKVTYPKNGKKAASIFEMTHTMRR